MKENGRIAKTIFLLSLVLVYFSQARLASVHAGADEPAKFDDLEGIFARLLNRLLPLAGMAVFIMLIIGGFQYITAGDNPKNAEKASNTLTYAIGGLIVIIAAWLILQLIQAITGFNVTTFRIISS